MFGSTATCLSLRYVDSHPIPTAEEERSTPSQLAGLANIASNYLIAGQGGSRHGTSHPSIVPYQVFPCKDGFIMIGAGNDKQVRLSVQPVEVC